MTNSDRLQEIRERVEKATPGPWIAPSWEVDDEPILMPLVMPAWKPHMKTEDGEEYECEGCDDCLDSEGRSADPYFVASAREDIPYLLQLVTEQREVLDSAVRFIESALVICARSCNPGDGLHVSWGEDICKAARALGPLNALEELRQKNETKGYRKQERPI